MNFYKSEKKFFTTFAIFFATTIFALTFFSGCPISINIKSAEFENNKNSAESENLKIEFSTKAGIELFKIVNNFSENEILSDAKIFNEDEIKDSLIEIGYENPNVVSTKIQNEEELLNIDFEIKKNKFSFLKILESKNNQIKKIEITLSPELLQNLIYNQNSIIQQYADLLMAPVFTNEKMSKEEYVDLISSVYGTELATELINGALLFSINDASTATEKVALDLLDVLTLTTEKKFILETK